MHISATIRTTGTTHSAAVSTGGSVQTISIAAKADGRGSAVNGGELLMLALATCYGNDLYREAARLGIALRGVEVVAEADFEGIGLAAVNIRYRARVDSSASIEDIQRLARETDAGAEIHHTIGAGLPVVFEEWPG